MYFGPAYENVVVELHQGQPSASLTDEVFVALPFDRVVRKETDTIFIVGKDAKVAINHNMSGNRIEVIHWSA